MFKTFALKVFKYSSKFYVILHNTGRLSLSDFKIFGNRSETYFPFFTSSNILIFLSNARYRLLSLLASRFFELMDAMLMKTFLCDHASNTVINECKIEQKHSNSESSKKKFVFLFGMAFIMLLFRAIRKTVFNTINIILSNMIADEIYEIEIPIIIEKNLATYEYDSFARSYHAYMDIWNPLIGEMLKYKPESTIEVEKHAVAIVWSNSLDKESVVGHISQSISEMVKKKLECKISKCLK